MLANIGDGLLKNSKDRRLDLKNLGHIVTYMSTPAAILSADANNARNASQQAKHFTEKLRTSTYKVIMAVREISLTEHKSITANLMYSILFFSKLYRRHLGF
jgi:alkylated DNA nucleotide flippase Atl1